MTQRRSVRRWARDVRARFVVAAIASVVASSVMVWTATQAAFNATTDNSGNTVGSGTVVLTDNDADSALFTMTNAVPGNTQTKCINVTYTGTLGAQVRLRAASVGALAPYLTLTVTRGTFSSVPGSGLCTGFANDTANYTGNGAGVLYSGLLSGFPSTWAGGLVDPSTTTSPTPEVWTTNEAHAYQLTLTINDDNNAQNKTSTPTFTWEARDAGDAAAGSYYAQAVLADNPASFWRLNDTTGTTAVDTKGAVNGTYVNGVVLNQPGPFEDGAPAAAFDGTNDHVNAGDVYDFTGQAAFSVEFWMMRTRSSVAYDRLLSTEAITGARNGWGLLLTTSAAPPANRIAFGRYSGGTVNEAVSTTATTQGRWHHVVATYDGTTMSLYLDGVLEHSRASSLVLPTVADSLNIARHPNGNARYGGRLADVAIYSYALSQTQVQAHYNARN